MTVILFIFLAWLAASISASSVTVFQPLNYQLPQVARVGQPYSWTFSPSTFKSTDGYLTYSTSSLPDWLSFDESTQTFHGTPSASHKGYPDITVTAHTPSSSTSSKFTICITDVPPPTLNLPISEQFYPGSKSLSSVYFPQPKSALSSANPLLRIPPKWSFSVGIDYETFLGHAGRNIYYELRMANGSDIPDYLNFNSKTVTLDGVTPPANKIIQPLILPLALHASDQEGYTAAILLFDLCVAEHELSMLAESLPTINVTASMPFSVGLQSINDVAGVLVDGTAIHPANISSMEVDVSEYSDWLHYDQPSRTLYGTPGNDVTGTTPTLPVTLVCFNQTLLTNIALALVPSYFVLPVLPSLHVTKGDHIQNSLTPWFSKSSAKPGFDGTNIMAVFNPVANANFMRYDDVNSVLEGTIPMDYQSDSDHFTLEFTAYSSITHTTSHTSLGVYVSSTGNTQSLAPTHPSGLATAAHKRLVLGVVLTFGLIGGLCTLAGIFAILRRCARVEDTAVMGEEGRAAWSENDMRWYGMTLSPSGTRVVEKPGSAAPSLEKPRGGLQPDYGSLGLGLRRVSERSQQEMENSDSQEQLLGPGRMSKREFLTKIKETVRQVSDKYARKRQAIRAVNARPAIAIGRPILVSSTRNDPQGLDLMQDSSSNPFDDNLSAMHSRPGSTFMTGSPSTSTAEHSIPRRRPDFAPPKNLAAVHFKDGLLVRQPSTTSVGANSFLSGKSGLSGDSYLESSMGPPTKPRLVPFTNSTRVPVPQAISAPSPSGSGFAGSRVTSQRAKVCESISKEGNTNGEGLGIKPSGTSDELQMSIHYVRSLGADQLAVHSGLVAGSSGSPALSNVRSSFTSLESSHAGQKSGTVSVAEVIKVLVRTGERFKFRVPVPTTSREAAGAAVGYHVKLTSGRALPKFIHVDLSRVEAKGALELTGVATFRDLGETSVGVYADGDGACVASMVIEVVSKR